MSVFDVLPAVYREYYGCFDALRVLGFPASDIFFHTNPKTRKANCVLRSQGLELGIPIGELSEPEMFLIDKHLHELKDGLPKIPQFALKETARDTWAYRNSVTLVVELVSYGFRLPCADFSRALL